MHKLPPVQDARVVTIEEARAEWAEADIISTYTRAQAIEDGILVDLMQNELEDICRQHFKYPIACTVAVFEIMQKAVENSRYCNDYAGILHDMLWMSHSMGRQVDEQTRIFRVIIQRAGRQQYYDLKIVCHPGDQGEPVLTIMLPGED